MNLSEIVAKHGDQFISAVEAELRKLAAEQPDFIYKTDPNRSGICRYDGPCRAGVTADKPCRGEGSLLGPECSGCIFGQALRRLGWDDKSEMSLVARIDATVDQFVRLNADFEGCPDSWVSVQQRQDTGSTWAVAVRGLDKASNN